MSTQSNSFVYTPTSSGIYTWRFRRVHSGANAPASSYTLDNLKVSYVIPYTRTECPETDLAYRFGFNTQEKDDEVYGAGNLNTAEFWEYDTRIGRRWNLDPKPTDGFSDYSVMLNNPIQNNDVNGDWPSLGDYTQKAKSYFIKSTKNYVKEKIVQVTNDVIDKINHKINYYQKKLEKTYNNLVSDGNGGSQKGGIHMTSGETKDGGKEGGASPTKQKATEQATYMDNANQLISQLGIFGPEKTASRNEVPGTLEKTKEVLEAFKKGKDGAELVKKNVEKAIGEDKVNDMFKKVGNVITYEKGGVEGNYKVQKDGTLQLTDEPAKDTFKKNNKK